MGTGFGFQPVVQCYLGLGNVLTIDGEIEEAEPLLREALSIQEKALEPGHLEIAETRLRLGQLLLRKGDMEQASGYLNQSITILSVHFGSNYRLVEEARATISALP